jgi:pimeloyl-ACP methyl ester carboxylesterase
MMDDRDVLDHRLIGDRYFFPAYAPLPDATRVPIEGGALTCWRSAPADARPVLVHFHGNGELVHHWQEGPLADAVRAAGWTLFLAEYRGYGGSSGQPRLLTMLDDTPAILDAVGVAPERIVVFGRSVGSIFAVDWVRRYPQTAGLVLESGIFDVHERLALRVRPHEVGAHDAAHFKRSCDARFDHGAVLSSYGSPSLILHAEHDDLVEISHAERSADAAMAATFVRFARGDHNSILAANQDAYQAALTRYLRQIAARMAA